MSDQPALYVLSTGRLRPLAFTYCEPVYPIDARLYVDDLNHVCFTVAFLNIRIQRGDYAHALEIEWALLDDRWHAFIEADLEPIFTYRFSDLPDSDVIRAAGEAAIGACKRLGWTVIDKRPTSILDVRDEQEP